ncbi:alpha-L-rhamnosidase C-terminal domain-containing protein [Streptomyces sp. NPDC003522]
MWGASCTSSDSATGYRPWSSPTRTASSARHDAAARGRRPRPGGGLTWASARHDSLHGPLACRWRRRGEEFTVAVTVPPGTTAEVRLPGSEPVLARPGTHTYTVALPRG